MELFPKWIIEDSTLIIGKASFHRHLATNTNNVRGGGWYHFDFDREAFILYGKSEDFGRCSKELVHALISAGNVGRSLNDDRYKGYKFYFSSSDKLENALDNAEELIPNEFKREPITFPKTTIEEYQHASRMESVSASPKIGRNEPCPCRSGKKYKKCCLK